MKAKPIAEFLALLIVMCLGLLFIIRLSKYANEGFFNLTQEQYAYNAVGSSLRIDMVPYCKIANLVQEQMMKAYMSTKVIDPLPIPPPKPIAEPKIMDGSEATAKSSGKNGWWGDSAPAMAAAKESASTTKSPPDSNTPDMSKIGVTPAPAETQDEAWNHVLRTYQHVYNCTDELRTLRPQCLGGGLLFIPTPHPDWKYVPCTGYILPIYNPTDQVDMIVALTKIPNHMVEKLTMEVMWYSSVISKLQEALDKGNVGPGDTPPSIPENPEMPKEEGKNESPAPPQPNPKVPAPSKEANAAQNKLLSARGFKPLGSKKEGFLDNNKCSPEAMALRRRRKLEADADSCTMPTLESEIKRVNDILNSKGFMDVMNLSRKVLTAAMKLQSDLEKLKAGTLYDWQKTGAKKTYTKFKGGDRTAAFLASASQNKDFSYSG
jgi:hypothetical protein